MQRINVAVFSTIVVASLAATRALGQISCGPEMAVCATEGAFCTTPDDQPGTCVTTFLIPPNQSPFCTCLPPSGGDGGEPGDGAYGGTPVSNVRLGASGNIQPGAQLDFAGILPAQVHVTKGAVSQDVSLSGASIEVAISPITDATGRSTFTVVEGGGGFASYVFGGVPIAASSFVVERGNGWIRWSDGKAWGSLRVRVTTAGFGDIRAVAYGPATVNLSTDILTLDPTALSVEFASLSVATPDLPPWGIAVLVTMLAAAGAYFLRGKFA